jgi:hypothetical protein
MPAFVHVARILPGKRQEFLRQVQEGFSANPEALRAFGFRRITSFCTPEVAADADGLLVTVFEVDDASVLERFYSLEPVRQQEERAHGVLVAPHDHSAVPRNEAFIDLRLDG